MKKQFSRVFYGYDRKYIDELVAMKLQEFETEKRLAASVQEQLEDMLGLLKLQLETARVRQSVLKRTFIYAKDFKDYLQYKAVETAEAVLQEAAEYVLAKEHEAADILRKIDDIEKNLALVYKETSSILAAVSSENNAFSSVQVIPFLKVFEETKPNIEELSVHTCEKNQQANNTAIKRSVLLAEEDAVIAKLLASTLEREGFSVTLVNDGKEALRLIYAATPPDIAMLDFMLPYVGGLQLLKQIRGNKKWAKTVVFMIADSLLERDVIFAMKNGADDYIQKPFNPRELAVKLVRFVERTHIS